MMRMRKANEKLTAVRVGAAMAECARK